MRSKTEGIDINKKSQLEDLAEKIQNLEASPLYSYRKEKGYLPVIGEGNLDAEVMFVGEAPGKKEAKSGRPFVGSAGQVLDSLLGSIGIKREDVYITNVVKDRPPDNRNLQAKEIELYAPFLTRQAAAFYNQDLATRHFFSSRINTDQHRWVVDFIVQDKPC